MPEATLKSFADHGRIGSPVPPDGGDCEATLARFAQAGVDVDVDAVAAKLQEDGAKAFVASWNELMAGIEVKCARVARGG